MCSTYSLYSTLFFRPATVHTTIPTSEAAPHITKFQRWHCNGNLASFSPLPWACRGHVDITHVAPHDDRFRYFVMRNVIPRNMG